MADRTQIAAMALQGLLAARQDDNFMPQALAELAVTHADELISYLSETAPAAPVVTQEDAAPSLRDLGVSGRAAAPLERMGVHTLAQLAVQTRADISEVKGVSRETLKLLDRLLEDNGLSWDWSPDQEEDDEPETVSDADGETEDEDLEDVL